MDALVNKAIEAAERGRVPDAAIRLGMNRLISARRRTELKRASEWRTGLRQDLWSGPIAISTTEANGQHYEVPAEFFEAVLGARLKYSSGYWPLGVSNLDGAEEAMLEISADRADLEDGQRILDLGCGWGSFALWAAERYPSSEIVGLSNSHSQRQRIETLAENAQLTNVRVVTADINTFRPDSTFDRIVSVEMLEHVRNHRELFHRARSWLVPDGSMFVHVFAHSHHEYPYEVSGPGSWMAGTFFTGGLMPSSTLIPDAADPYFRTDETWWIDGTHYSKTLEVWLGRMDSSKPQVDGILRPVYGDDLDLWVQRWRMFFMACSQMFKYRSGKEWGIAHHLLRPI
jgi:cyclopropane-fatty-acyl-phospholipid synthase